MKVGDICKRSVVTCTRNASAHELAKLMRDFHVGHVIVVDEAGGGPMPVGIVTDRDLVLRVLAEGVEADALRAGQLMAGALDTVLESDAVYDAVWQMRRRGIGRLPVVDAHGRLSGLLNKDDVTAYLAHELTEAVAVEPHEVRLAAAKT